MRQIIAQKDQVGSASSGWSKLLDIGNLYHNLMLFWPGAGLAIDKVTLIELLYNGITYWSLSGQELNDMNVRDGIPAFDGNTLIIPLDLQNMKDQRMKEMTGVNTGVPSPTNGKIINTFQLRVTLDPGEDQNFIIYADVEPSTPDGPGLVRRFNRYQKPSSVSAQGTTFSDLDFGNRSWAFWRRIFTKADAGAITYQGLAATSGALWGSPLAAVAAVNALALAQGQAALTYFSACMDFSLSGGGYTAVPKVAPADPKKPGSAPVIIPDTGNNPLLPTIPLNGQTLTMTNVNTVAGSNEFILEALGEIE